MTEQRLVDFDAFRAEQENRPLLFRFGGRDWALPSSPPAAVALEVIRLERTGTSKVAPDVAFKLAEGLFGGVPELLGRLYQLSLGDMLAAISEVMKAYQEDATPPPNRKRRRAETSRRRRST